MAVNKVTLGDETLIDLTNDTAEPEDVLEGAYFHTAAGVRTAGTRRNIVVDDELSSTSENPVQNKVITAELIDQKSALTDLEALTNRKAGMLVDTASGAIASFVPDATIPDLLGVSVAVEPVQSGSGDPSPDNVRPISGWSAVGIVAGGQNLFDGVYRYHNALSLTPVKAGQTYTISTKHVAGGEGLNICFFDGETYSNDQSVIQTGSTATTAHLTFSVPAGKTHVNVYTIVTGSNTDNALFDTQIQPGSTVSPYEEYRAPTTYSITLGQTVYGGTLDATNGTLTVKWTCLNTTWGDMTQASVGDITERRTVTLYPAGYGTRRAETISNIAVFENNTQDKVHYQMYYSGNGVSFFLPISTPDSTTVQFAYLLASPITLQLDPVTISTISGQTNNVWSDAGDVDVTYAADLKHYIDSKIAALAAQIVNS